MDESLFHFDDDIFDVASDRLLNNLECSESVTFQPKVSKWFVSVPCRPSERDNFGMITKFKADLAYKESRYEEAIKFYKLFQEHIKDINNMLWRASEEDIGRCYLKMNQFEKALSCAHNLESTASNIDHFTCLSNFVISIYEASQDSNSDNKMIQLKKLLLIHPGHSSSWLKLGQCILNLCLEDPSCDISQDFKLRGHALTCFAICFLLEKRRTCHPFMQDVSIMLTEKAVNYLEKICKDKEELVSFLEMIKAKHSLLTDADKHSLVSIEHWSPNNFLEILKNDVQTEEAFNQKWLDLGFEKI